MLAQFSRKRCDEIAFILGNVANEQAHLYRTISHYIALYRTISHHSARVKLDNALP
jgi:hypothetical protein